MERNNKLEFPYNIMTEEIVISGVSGRFPESDSTDEFRDNLFNHVDMITGDDRRWPKDLYGMSPRMGKVKELDKLDTAFFNIVPKVADEVDPAGRILLETTYEAICDAGFNPQSLRGSNTGVYVGYTSVTMPDGVPQEVQEDIQASKTESLFWFQGSSKAFYANRISFMFDFKGPSMSIDVACAASMVCLDIAITDMRLGKCDQAIVAGVSINLQPFTNHIYQVNSIGSKDGMSRVWDQDASGYVRGETVASLFLQKSSDAKRIYATVLNSRTNIDGYKITGMFFPSTESQYDLMVTTYSEAGIDPHDVNYFEGHGTGTKVGDPQEAKAILDAYCKDRTTELPVGLLKSNIGHGEGASGVASLAKLIIVYENKKIPACLNLKNLKTEIAEMVPPLIPVTTNRDYEPGIAGVNSFGIGGVNCHALLKPNKKELSVNGRQVVNKIPRLVNVCGRTEEAVNHIFEFIEKNPQRVTQDFLALLGEIVNPVPAIYSAGHPYRGSLLIKKQNNSLQYSRKVTKVENSKRPICYFFSGMGSQWTAMAKSLMDIEIFSQSIHKSANILKQFDIDLQYILLSEDPKALEEKIHHFVAITSMQVALVDVFQGLGITPDVIIGHSFGEIACAYADGCLTLEQAVTTSYWRGKAIKDANIAHGMMAAVGLTWEETKKRCPEGVYAACHNSEDSVTISGAYNDVEQCVQKLVSDKIFAKEVACANIPFHSPLLAPATTGMTNALKNILTVPKPRSSKWISTSVPESDWNKDSSRYASAEYFVNNLISPVLFHESSAHIPKDAIIIELAPHALFSAIFKRSMPSSQYIGLLKRNNNSGNLELFLDAIGQLYQLGVNLKVACLYPKVQWPVARDTQSISSLIRWDHSKSFLVKLYPDYHNQATAADFVQRFSLSNADYVFLKDHAFDGRCVFPATAYLLVVWRRLAATYGKQWFQLPVVFENVSFKRLTPLSEDDEIRLTVRLLDPTGEFVVLDGQNVAVTGRVSAADDTALQYQDLVSQEVQIQSDIWRGHKIDTNEFYTELNVRGFDYGPLFRKVQEVQYDTLDRSYSMVKLDNSAIGADWITFVESMIQLYITHTTGRGVYVALDLPSLKCDPNVLLSGSTRNTNLPVVTDSRRKYIVSRGIEIKGLTFANIPLKNVMHEVQMEKYEFVAHNEDQAIEDIDLYDLQQYVSQCNLLAEKIAESIGEKTHKSGETSGDLFHNIMIREVDNNQTLLNLLVNLYKSVFDENGNAVNNSKVNESIVRKVLLNSRSSEESSQYDISLDQLNSIQSNGRLLRSILDIVNENHQRNISIAEFNPTNSVLAPAVLYNMGFFFHYPLVVDYTLASPDVKNLPENIQQSGYQLVEWDTSKTSLPSLSAPSDLLIYRDCVCNPLSLETLTTELANNVKDNGFMLAVFRTNLCAAETLVAKLSDRDITNQKLSERLTAFEGYAKTNQLVEIARKSDSIASTAILLRKCTKNISAENQAVVEVKYGRYDEWVEELKQKFKEYKDRPKTDSVWLFANDCELNGIIGLVNCLRQEPGGDRFRCIVTDRSVSLPIDFKSEQFAKILKTDLVMNILRDNQWGSYRLLNLERAYNQVSTREAYLDVAKKGDLKSLEWRDLTNYSYPRENPVNVKIYYSGLDQRDLALATGQLGSNFVDKTLGFEFGGRRSDTGVRVMGISSGRSIATSIDTNESLLLNVPDMWSIEDGVSAISAYFTVWYSLVNKAQVDDDDTILIHSGCEPNGLAAIRVAQSLGARVLTTASTPEKKQFLIDSFNIPENCIFSPSDPKLSDQIIAVTDGKGVDVLLNSLSAEGLLTAEDLVAEYGCYVEIDNYGQSSGLRLSKNTLFYNISTILSEETLNKHLPKIFVAFKEWFSEGLENGAIKPIPRVVHRRNNIDKALKLLTSGQTIGKVLIKIRDEEPFDKTTTNKRPVLIEANTRTWFEPQKVYVLVGGLGGLGLEVAYWMAERGAKKLVLVSRSGIKNDYQYTFLKRVELAAPDGQPVLCKISTSDPSSIVGAEKLITEAQALGPVGGIFHFATVLNDAFIEDQTAQTFKKVCAPKVDALSYLDAVTRKFCPTLDYFVAFSSQSSGRGFVGQNNYGYANSVMEHICELRRKDGLSGLAIQYGPIGDVGLWAANENIDLTSIGMVINTQRIPSCLEVLDRFLHLKHPIVSTIVRREGSQQSGSDGTGSKNSVWQGIGIDMSSLPDDLTLGDVGMESILAVEMQQRIEREYEVSLTTDEIKLITIRQIRDYQSDELSNVKTKMADWKKSLKK